MDDPQQQTVVSDFIFGTLATDALRLESLRAERRGLWHDRERPLAPRPGEPITISVGLGTAVVADRVTLYYTSDGSPPDGARGQARQGLALPMRRTSVEWDTLLWGYVEQWQAQVPPLPAGSELRYMVEAWHSTGGTATYAGGEQPQIFGLHVADQSPPDWLRDAVIYQVFVDRFAPDPGATFKQPPDPLAGYYGGTLRGVSARLDYLADLGITCLWLTPVFPSPTHHGYDATDYESIEPRLGSEEDLQELLEGAHRRGIRVILDLVCSHCSSLHPAFVAAQADRAAETAQWFTFEEWPQRYRSFFGVAEMPQINTDNPAARNYLLGVARRWIERGVDGFRLDYANGPSHAFWSALRATVRAADPEGAMLGEVVETPLLQRSYAGRMDGCLDFVLLQALRGFFAFDELSPSQLDVFLRRHFAYFPDDLLLPSFLDNHDMNRFLWVVRGDQRRLRLAALCQFTLPGPPILYYGTEVGLSQGQDVRYADGSGHPEEARMPMLWGPQQNRELLDFYRQLVALRRAGQPAWRGPRTTLLADDEQGILGYACGPYAVVLNNGAWQRSLRLDAWQGAQVALATDSAAEWDAHGRLQLPPYAGICLYRP